MSPTYRYPRPSVTLDVALFARRDERLVTLLIRRKRPPFRDAWALPGGFLDMDETLEAGARRELEEETGLRIGAMRQMRAYGDPGRDPRGRTVSIVFLALHAREAPPVGAAGDDASELRWFPTDRPPELAFDHRDILRDARAELVRLATSHDRDLVTLIGPRFEMSDAAALYRCILGPTAPSRDALRRRLLRNGVVSPPKRRSGLYRVRSRR